MNIEAPHLPLTTSMPEISTNPAHAARQFEGFFFSLLMQHMRQTLEPDGFFPGDTGDVLGGLFDQTLGDHLARPGHLGIARLIEAQFRQANPVARGESFPSENLASQPKRLR